MKTIINYINESLKLGSNKVRQIIPFKELNEIATIYSNDSKAYTAWETDYENGDTDCSWEDFDTICWEDAQDEINRMDNSELCVIVGDVERWHGKKQIIPTETKSLMDAINECIGKYCEQLRLTILEDFTIKCEVGHHDGLNIYNIIGLNNKGAELFEEWAESDDDNSDINFIIYNTENRVKFDIL